MIRQDPPAQAYTREAFWQWCAEHAGHRYERVGGRIVAMSPERAAHVRVKGRVFTALQRAIQMASVPCEAMPDGVTVETGDNDYVPDALVNCGLPMVDDAVSAPNPVIVVEVLSPSTAGTDTGGKLAGYFNVPSVAHYLIIHPTRRSVIHHRRETSGGIATRILSSGLIRLDPPGISVMVESFYGG